MLLSDITTEDLENAPVDPFSLDLGRHNIFISEALETDIGSDPSYHVLKVTCRSIEDENQKHDVLFFLEGDDDSVKKTKSAIKKMLTVLEIPVSEWSAIMKNPALLVGHKAVVELKANKNPDKRPYFNWLKVYYGGSDTGMDVFTGEDPADKANTAAIDEKLGF